MMKIAGKPAWWVILCLIPIVSIVIFFIVNIEIAKRFGKDALYGVGLTLLGFIFYPLLGFSDATYQGGSAPAA
jgi:hypothetical protein